MKGTLSLISDLLDTVHQVQYEVKLKKKNIGHNFSLQWYEFNLISLKLFCLKNYFPSKFVLFWLSLSLLDQREYKLFIFAFNSKSK